jgi:hypothetical protein
MESIRTICSSIRFYEFNKLRTPPNLPHYLKLAFPFFIDQKTSIFIRSIILFLHDPIAMHYELILEHIRKHISLDKDEEGQIIALLKTQEAEEKAIPVT